ncbi:hypothetical protein MZD92_19670 [Escherichia coli]|nr:hypothetical protein [Escherichia coli]
MKISKLVVVATVCSTLSACSVEEMAAVNKKISDGAFAVTKALNGGTGYADNGMPILNKQLPPEQDKRENVIDVPVDVDTAAGRLKRYYKFYSNDEVNAIRNNGTTDGKWQASAIIDNGHIWDAMPGSYYKMGGNWRKGSFDDHLTIEVEKNGKGSRVYITYASSSQAHLQASSLEPLFKRVKDVAEGKVR